ncbi:MAG TPA: hypothetical protein VM617_07985 [Thermoanaerobaculia bacterium]|nr:hypothetical protein [Thermoanaerobaculia bacterium]
MTAGELLQLAWQTAAQTASYLFAFAFVLVLAPLAHFALLALAPVLRGRIGEGGAGRFGGLGAVAAASTSPLGRRAIEDDLRRAGSAPAAIVYLAVSHALTAYSWILLGPLLGKDFLLSHVVGVGLFVVIAAGLARITRVATAAEGRPGSSSAPPGRGLPVLLGGAALRYVLLAVLGLALGGLIAAWGFSPWSWAPADLARAGLGTQLANGILGIALALLGVPPVANLFVGTYLWKVGLAHAGIVAFFCAATAAPTRWRLYARVFGRAAAGRLVASLVIAALLAGLLTAWTFGAADLTIRYKLIPEQLWEVP